MRGNLDEAVGSEKKKRSAYHREVSQLRVMLINHLLSAGHCSGPVGEQNRAYIL